MMAALLTRRLRFLLDLPAVALCVALSLLAPAGGARGGVLPGATALVAPPGHTVLQRLDDGRLITRDSEGFNYVGGVRWVCPKRLSDAPFPPGWRRWHAGHGQPLVWPWGEDTMLDVRPDEWFFDCHGRAYAVAYGERVFYDFREGRQPWPDDDLWVTDTPRREAKVVPVGGGGPRLLVYDLNRERWCFQAGAGALVGGTGMDAGQAIYAVSRIVSVRPDGGVLYESIARRRVRSLATGELEEPPAGVIDQRRFVRQHGAYWPRRSVRVPVGVWALPEGDTAINSLVQDPLDFTRLDGSVYLDAGGDGHHGTELQTTWPGDSTWDSGWSHSPIRMMQCVGDPAWKPDNQAFVIPGDPTVSAGWELSVFFQTGPAGEPNALRWNWTTNYVNSRSLSQDPEENIPTLTGGNSGFVSAELITGTIGNDMGCWVMNDEEDGWIYIPNDGRMSDRHPGLPLPMMVGDLMSFKHEVRSPSGGPCRILGLSNGAPAMLVGVCTETGRLFVSDPFQSRKRYVDGDPDGFLCVNRGGVLVFRDHVAVGVTPAPPVFADMNGDGCVDSADLAMLLGTWGVCPDPALCFGDFNGDDAVDSADLGLLIGAFGTGEGCGPAE